MQEKDISIIIVNYNVKDFLLQCLRSVRQATGSLNVETIVVDNNSADGSVESLQPLFPEVQFIKLEKNVGFAKANNTGFSHACGKYFLILNPDTILGEDTLETMYRYMENNPEVGIAGCKVLNPDGSFQVACRRGFPTPWASFSKLFGLQSLFPNSRLFAGYNQTFRSTDETYYIDALIGAFMFARREVIGQLKGFDGDFFMYGEDLDLCFRASEAGWKTAYVHETSIIHYKGESTRRSSINELKHFYEAMVIFSDKHYSKSKLFLFFLKSGILVRAGVAQMSRYVSTLLLLLLDVLAINGSLLLATKQKFGAFLGFHDYAYPTVFIAATLVMIFSMIAAGEYFDEKHSIRKSFFGLMITFLILSALTYYFKEYAFSREVLIMTIVFTSVIIFLTRVAVSAYNKFKSRNMYSRIAIVGNASDSAKLVDYIRNNNSINSEIVGIIRPGGETEPAGDIPVLGSIDYINKIIDDYAINEVLIADREIKNNDLVRLAGLKTKTAVRYHAAQEFDDFMFARIVSDISGVEPTMPRLNISKLRPRIIKRTVDLGLSLFFMTIGLPLIYLIIKDRKHLLKKLWFVFIGKYSFIGVFDIEGYDHDFGKKGITGLVHISDAAKLSREAIIRLNDYYLMNYSLSLDLDIFLKLIIRKNRGNKIRT